MSREKFSAEDILLGIHFAKREVARTRPDRDSCRPELHPSLYPEYFSARKNLTKWNQTARRFCAKRARELEGYPIEFVIPGVFLDVDRGVLCCAICKRTKGLPRELAELEETARKFRENHTHKKESKK